MAADWYAASTRRKLFRLSSADVSGVVLFFKAVSNLDYPLLQGLFLMLTFAVLGANLIVDLLYIRLDPRVRTQ